MAPGWIDTDEAARLSGYHRDYLRQLCRKEPQPFKAERRGNMWWIDEASFKAFLEEQQAAGDVRYGPRK